MNIKQIQKIFLLHTLVGQVSFTSVYSMDTRPAASQQAPALQCAICLEESENSADNANFTTGAHEYGCDERHIFHRACVKQLRDTITADHSIDGTLADQVTRDPRFVVTNGHRCPVCNVIPQDVACKSIDIEGDRYLNYIRIKTLIRKGIGDINAPNEIGETALMRAVRASDQALVSLLLNGNAIPHLTNALDQTAFDIALDQGNQEEIIMMLLSYDQGILPALQEEQWVEHARSHDHPAESGALEFHGDTAAAHGPLHDAGYDDARRLQEEYLVGIFIETHSFEEAVALARAAMQ